MTDMLVLEGESVAVLQHWKGILAGAMVLRGRKLSPEGPLWRNQYSPQAFFSSSKGEIRVLSANFLAILPPPRYHPLQDMLVTMIAHPLISPRSRMSPMVIPSQRVAQIWFVQIPLRPAIVTPSRKIGGRSRIEGAAPARRVEGQDITPEHVSAEQDFAGEEPEPDGENFTGGEPGPSAEDSCDGLAEQDTAGRLKHQVKIDKFQAFISRLSMAERLRVLGLPEVQAVRLPVKTPSIRSAVELSKENPGSGALSRENFRSAAGGRSFNAASRKFSNLGSVEFHAPPVMTREEQVARETQELEIPPAAAQDKAEAASARFAQAISHADATDFDQLSSDVQPRPTSKTLLVTRSSQPVPNTMYYALFPENGDRDACPNFPHDVFTSGDLSAEISRLQDEVTLCRQRIASYPSEIQGMCAAIGRYEQFRSELAAGIEAEKKKANLDWRRSLECLDRRKGVSLVEYDHRHRELHWAIK